MIPPHLSHAAARLFLAFTLFFVASSGCNRRPGGEEEDSGPSERAVVPVRIAPVSRGDAQVTVPVTGKTDALKKEKVFSPVAGWIVSLKALEGTAVRKGAVLATIRPKEAQSAIAGAQALLERARTAAQEEEARKALELAESGQNTVTLRASFDGVVGTRAVTEGELVGENAELFTIVDLSTLVFIADIPFGALPEIHPGESANIRFTGLADRVFRGVVEALSPQSDPQSQTVRARIRFVGSVPAILRTDMAGTARIVTAVHRQALLVPRSALLHDDEHDTYSVVLVTPDTIARGLPVTVGALTDSVAEITGGGLQPGMQVVVEGNYALADSTRVSISGDGSP
jgi:multidrug efflux pump subunit AcrA (membrane-fusion protein)